MMNSTQHFDVLKAKHNDLDQALDIENKRPYPDERTIIDLKKQKLRIKDKLAEYSH